ncbi:MAG TPA: metallophosphoesterase [Tepidisphaeraceae bacterium]|jgi:3',5'-cyclic AMP phosphodiesterase CpdA|nr:metallophosphoesterase [Tepidisphaeraceae bacterium]
MRTIAHISDLHFGTVDPTVAEGLVRDIAGQKPDVVVASGDFTQRARVGQYKAAAEFLRRLPAPQIVVPGNHDIPLWNVIRRFFLPLTRYRKYISHDLRPTYRDDELMILGINTARPFSWSWDGFWKDGRISEEQLLDIQMHLCDVPASVFKIVVTHHPFIPPPGERMKGMVHGAKQALPRLEQCNVDLLLAGHLHRGYSGDVRTHYEAARRSMLSIQAATATSMRRRGEPNAYNVIKTASDAVSVETRAWNGNAFIPIDTTHYRKRDHIWHRE